MQLRFFLQAKLERRCAPKSESHAYIVYILYIVYVYIFIYVCVFIYSFIYLFSEALETTSGILGLAKALSFGNLAILAIGSTRSAGLASLTEGLST